MSVSLKINGLEEFRQALQQLPRHLAQEASTIVLAHARQAEATIRSKYEQHHKTGNLAQHVVLDQVEVSEAGAKARVRSTARHAYIVEHKSLNIRRTEKGWNRGVMTPLDVFIPTAVRERSIMVRGIVGMMRREGFIVEGV